MLIKRRFSLNWLAILKNGYFNSVSISGNGVFKNKQNYLLVILLLSFVNNINALLPVSATQLVHGNSPMIAVNDEMVDSTGFKEKLSVVSMPDGRLRTSESDINDFKLEPDTTLSQISWVIQGKEGSNEVKKVIEANGQDVNLMDIANNLNISIFDQDGDTGIPDGVLTATWYYSVPGGYNGNKKGLEDYKKVPENELTKTIDPCKAPYKLELSVKNIKVETEYGLPNESEHIYNDLFKTYYFKSKINQVCYARPYPMMDKTKWSWIQYNNDEPSGYGWEASIDPTPNPKHGGGYNKDEWHPELGFLLNTSAGHNNRFPHTAFKGASFQLWMSNHQQDYLFSTDDENLSIDKLGILTFKGKPKKRTIQIFAWPKDANGESDRIVFWSDLNFWAIPGEEKLTYSDDLCGGIQNQLTLTDWINTPQATNPNTNASFRETGNAMTRKMNGGLSGEWGQLTVDRYAESGFPTSGAINGTFQRHAWVSDFTMEPQGKVHRVVFMLNGGIFKAYNNPWPSAPFSVTFEVCKETW